MSTTTAATVAAKAAELHRQGRGTFGGKVFLRYVREAMGLDRAAFGALVVEANRTGALRLSRADLVEAMDPADVRESEVAYGLATFHFVRVG